MKVTINVKQEFDENVGIRSLKVKRETGNIYQYIAAKEITYFFRFLGCVAIISEKGKKSLSELQQEKKLDDMYQKLAFTLSDNTKNKDVNSIKEMLKYIIDESANDTKLQEVKRQRLEEEGTDVVILLERSFDDEDKVVNREVMRYIINELKSILGEKTQQTIAKIYDIWEKYNIFKMEYIYLYYRYQPFTPITDEIWESIKIYKKVIEELQQIETTSDLGLLYKILSDLNSKTDYLKAFNFLYDEVIDKTPPIDALPSSLWDKRYEYSKHSRQELWEERYREYTYLDVNNREKIEQAIALNKDFYGTYIVAGDYTWCTYEDNPDETTEFYRRAFESSNQKYNLGFLLRRTVDRNKMLRYARFIQAMKLIPLVENRDLEIIIMELDYYYYNEKIVAKIILNEVLNIFRNKDMLDLDDWYLFNTIDSKFILEQRKDEYKYAETLLGKESEARGGNVKLEDVKERVCFMNWKEKAKIKGKIEKFRIEKFYSLEDFTPINRYLFGDKASLYGIAIEEIYTNNGKAYLMIADAAGDNQNFVDFNKKNSDYWDKRLKLFKQFNN